ncbi:MAG: uracil-DNA glycosylase family protein [Burkholderiales bacterium]
MNRRELILKEMGLGPRWRLRTATDAAPSDGACELDAAPNPATGDRDADLPPRGEKAARPVVKADLANGADGVRSDNILAMQWPALKAAVAGCTACGLCKTRTNTVFGVGDEEADWMLVGEAPGAEEDARGEPFVGQAGRLLDNMLSAIDLARGKSVYIANVLKCRPPGNRNPEPGEVARCSPHLIRQIALIRPKLIVAMGRFAAQTLLASDASISSMRGRRYQYQGVPLIVTYHPAYLLRSLQDKSKAWEDLLFARRTMRSLAAPSPQTGG